MTIITTIKKRSQTIITTIKKISQTIQKSQSQSLVLRRKIRLRLWLFIMDS